MRTRRGRPFTKDILAKDIRKVREKLGIPSELKLADLRRTAWTEMANKGATVPELANALILGGWNLGYHGAAVAAAIAYDTGLSPGLVRSRLILYLLIVPIYEGR